jgi:membrane-bound lytic murein transglycosylase D
MRQMIVRLIKKIILLMALASGLTACIGDDPSSMDNQDPSQTTPKWVSKAWVEGSTSSKTIIAADKESRITSNTSSNMNTSASSNKANNWLSAFKLTNEINRSSGNLWDTLPDNFQMQHYAGSPEVQAQIRWFMSHQEYLNRTIRRAAPYMYYIYQQVQRRNLPTELVLLPIIESAYNPFGYSYMGAAGLWQIMPQTATSWGIKRNWWFDGRRDIFASTNAALDYLTYLQNYFNGNWLLAVAAYNTGEGNVQSAIRRNVRLGKNTEFWDLPLSQQTQAYVPRLLALAAIIADRKTNPINLPPINDKPYLSSVDVGSHIDLNLAAQLAGMNAKELYQLNPGYNHWATDPNGPYVLILPVDKIDSFKTSLAKYPREQRIVLQHYKVRVGDTLAKIADRFDVDISKIKKTNSLALRRIKPGKTLLIPITTLAVSQTIRKDSVGTVLAKLDKATNGEGNNEINGGENNKQFASLLGDSQQNSQQSPEQTVNLASNQTTESSSEYPNEQSVGQGTDQTDAAKQSAMLTNQIVQGEEEGDSTAILKRLASLESTASKIVHRVKPHEHLWSIARAYKVDVKSLMSWNHIKANQPLKPGTRLVILRNTATRHASAASNRKSKVAKRQSSSSIQVADAEDTAQTGTVYKVLAGDTLNRISKRSGVSIDELKRLNNLSNSSKLHLGQKIIISEA